MNTFTFSYTASTTVLLLATACFAQRQITFNEENTLVVTPVGLTPAQSFLGLGNIRDPLDPGNGLMPVGFDLTDNFMIGRAPQAGDVVVIDTG